MTSDKQLEIFDKVTSRMREIIVSKREDYAGQDVLSNFKDAGKIAGLSTSRQCLSLIAVKVARLSNLLDSKNPNNESIEDSILDLANYSLLLYMIESEYIKEVEFSITDLEPSVPEVEGYRKISSTDGCNGCDLIHNRKILCNHPKTPVNCKHIIFKKIK